MSERLPDGWALASIADLVVDIEAGKSFKCDERPPTPEEIGVIKVSAVTWGEYREQESKTCTDSERVNPSLFVQPGDFLFSRANTIQLVGACVIVGTTRQRVMLSDKILRFHFAHQEHKPWAMHFLRSNEGRKQIEALASGNQESMRNIGQARIGEIRLPLPPPAEQVRIVAKLEELLSDLDAGVAELKAAQKKLAQYRQSLLNAAVEGTLTADWRAKTPPTETGAQLLQRILSERRARWEAKQLAKFIERGKAPPKDWQKKYPEPVQPDTTSLPELPKGWVWASVEQIASDERYSLSIGPFGSNLKVPDYRNSGVPLVFVRNIRSGNYGGVHTKYVTPEKALELNAHGIAAGDVLVTKMGEPPGDADVYPSDQPPAVITADCIKVRCWPGLMEPKFMKAVINSHIGRRQIEPMTQGVAQKKVSLGRFTSLAVPVPPADEQALIVQTVDVADREALEQLVAIDQSLRQSTAQRQNILRAAFAGQLVPQDPNDEPARVLLERIRALREGPRPAGGRRSKVSR